MLIETTRSVEENRISLSINLDRCICGKMKWKITNSSCGQIVLKCRECGMTRRISIRAEDIGRVG